jgi:RES domain-containing protein
VLPEQDLLKTLSSLPLVAVQGPWTRALHYRLLRKAPPGELPEDKPQPLWSKGPTVQGARFTPKGSFGSIYLASDAVTALLEVEAVFLSSDKSFVPRKTPPWTVFGVDGFLERVLDLTNPEILERLRTNLSELTGNWLVPQARFLQGKGPLPPTQLLAREAFQTGRIHGILYWSAKHTGQGVNLVVFSDRLSAKEASYLDVYDPDALILQRLPPLTPT